MIELCEMFSSIQGEGPFMGRPAVFVRLSRCTPPFCPWCDSRFARGPGEITPIDEILSRVFSLGIGLVVITGGEPFLQWESGLAELEAGLLAMGISIQYETSGKIRIPLNSKGFKVCSPKFIEGRWQFLSQNIHCADCFKFVVKDEYDRIEDFVNSHSLAREKVWIMPLGAVRKAQVDRSPKVWEFCVEKGFNFSPRLHTLVFNDKRGI